jgi:hypothetical protein
MTLLVTAVRDLSYPTTTWNFLIKLPPYSDDDNSKYDDDDDDDDVDTCMLNIREDISAMTTASKNSRRLRKY